MRNTNLEVVDLCSQLIKAPSLSGEEEAVVKGCTALLGIKGTGKFFN